MVKERGSMMRSLSLASFFGLMIGGVAGLIGVSGGEFRIPVLLHILKQPATTAVAANLFVGLLVVVASLIRRLQLGLLSNHYANIAFAMSMPSIVGAYLGARLIGKFPEKMLRKILVLFLIIVSLKVGIEPLIKVPMPSVLKLGFVEETLLSALIGLAIGIVAGYFGVAGGEFCIPALIYIFGLDIIDASTLSLLISVPTVASGLLEHHKMKHLNYEARIIAIAMGVSSVTGSLIGASYVSNVDKDLLKVMLGAILISSALRIATKL
ncbi:MAG: sulfite exporter TauE/SafE family protein [Ignisphaera sp.]